MSRTRVVLVGAGLAHLHCLRHGGEFTRRGHALTLIAPASAWYSGLASGVLAGACSRPEDRIDVARLAARAGATLLPGQATAIDLAGGTVRWRGGTVRFDILSLDIGSAPGALPGAADERCFPAKPIERLLELRTSLERRFAATSSTRAVVAGGGLSGFEIAAAMLGLARRLRGRLDLTLLAGRKSLRELPHGARRAVTRNLTRRGANVLTGTDAERIEDGRVATPSGGIPFDILVNATGSRPFALAADSGLPTDDDGWMLTDECLRSPGDDRIFGAGDCIAWNGERLSPSGVHAVRQGPVLLRNLLAALDGRAARAFVPQRRHLAIMNLGDGTALAARGPFWWQGRSALLLKNWIDRRFLRDNSA
jgi:NADH dehydrogenase FAD-containing subunit